jgi:hypothetical protein
MSVIREDGPRRKKLSVTLDNIIYELITTYNSECGQTMTIIEMTMFVEAMNKLKNVSNSCKKEN